MISFNINLSGLKDLGSLTKNDLRELHFGIGEIIDNHVVEEVDRQGLVDKGGFRNSIRHDEYDENHVLIYSKLDYAPHLEYGTRPHKITPKVKKALYWKTAEHPVKSVMHPGTKAYRPFGKGLVKSKRSVLNYLFREIPGRLK